MSGERPGTMFLAGCSPQPVGKVAFGLCAWRSKAELWMVFLIQTGQVYCIAEAILFLFMICRGFFVPYFNM